MKQGNGIRPPLTTSSEREAAAERLLHSALYTGQVRHQRTTPANNEFGYRLFMLYLDLAELDSVFSKRLFWSVEALNWASFRRTDHLRRPGPLDTGIRELVEEQLGFRPSGPIRLLTHLRYLGYCFNPISIYYCFGDDGVSLQAIVAEVHNTPWGEEYLRALDTSGGPGEAAWHRFQLDKEFHVSPFMPMDIRYTWGFTVPGQELAVHMENERHGAKVFKARLDLERRPLSAKNLALALARWPFMTAKVSAAIYWQALRIKLKGVPFYPHPDAPKVTKGRYYP